MTPTRVSSAHRSNFTTGYKNASGQQVQATRHEKCEGHGCDECKGLGFTTTVCDKDGWTGSA